MSVCECVLTKVGQIQEISLNSPLFSASLAPLTFPARSLNISTYIKMDELKLFNAISLKPQFFSRRDNWKEYHKKIVHNLFS